MNDLQLEINMLEEFLYDDYGSTVEQLGLVETQRLERKLTDLKSQLNSDMRHKLYACEDVSLSTTHAVQRGTETIEELKRAVQLLLTASAESIIGSDHPARIFANNFLNSTK